MFCILLVLQWDNQGMEQMSKKNASGCAFDGLKLVVQESGLMLQVLYSYPDWPLFIITYHAAVV